MKYGITSTLYKKVVKPLLFTMDPESVHDAFVSIGRNLGSSTLARTGTRMMFRFDHPSLMQRICGLDFKNPVGLSAGFDKNADLTDIMDDVGFGFMQVGTVTTRPYEGNPKPRAVRLPNSQALVVNYGLKNIGVDRIIEKMHATSTCHSGAEGDRIQSECVDSIARTSLQNDATAARINIHTQVEKFPVGISIGKTNSPDTIEVDRGVSDYTDCLKKIIDASIGDFYTINISCPNTFGGEPFIVVDRLEKLLRSLYTLRIDKPVFLKMPIHLCWDEFKPLCDMAVSFGVDGLIIGNLRKDRSYPNIKDAISVDQKGGISGKPTWDLSNDLISKTYKHYGDRLVVIGVGGIFSAEDAYEKIKRGASLVQLITGMIYEGPQLIGAINKDLVRLLKQEGYSNISDAVGAYYKDNKPQ